MFHSASAQAKLRHTVECLAAMGPQDTAAEAAAEAADVLQVPPAPAARVPSPPISTPPLWFP